MYVGSFSSSLLISMSCLKLKGPQFYSDMYMEYCRYLSVPEADISYIPYTLVAVNLLGTDKIYHLQVPPVLPHLSFGMYIVSLSLLPHCHSCING